MRKYSRILSHVYPGQGPDLTPITMKPIIQMGAVPAVVPCTGVDCQVALVKHLTGLTTALSHASIAAVVLLDKKKHVIGDCTVGNTYTSA